MDAIERGKEKTRKRVQRYRERKAQDNGVTNEAALGASNDEATTENPNTGEECNVTCNASNVTGNACNVTVTHLPNQTIPNQKIKDKTHVRSDERTTVDDPDDPDTENNDPPAENPSEDGGARKQGSGKGIEYTAEFEEFWDAYPRHVAKKDAFAAWKGQKRDKTVDAELVTQSARTYADAMRSLGKEEAYMLHAKTFLNKGRWREWLKPEGAAYLDAVKQYRDSETRKRGSPPPPLPPEAMERQSQRDRESEEYFRREQERLEHEFGGDYHDGNGNREAPQ
jgi:hypothetical protein